MVLRQSAASLAGTGWRGSLASATTVSGELCWIAVITLGGSSCTGSSAACRAVTEHRPQATARADKGKRGRTEAAPETKETDMRIPEKSIAEEAW